MNIPKSFLSEKTHDTGAAGEQSGGARETYGAGGWHDERLRLAAQICGCARLPITCLGFRA